MGDESGEYMVFVKAENDRLRGRVADLERENRVLWYANGKLREAGGAGCAIVRECAASGNGPEQVHADLIDNLLGGADKALGGIVPLVPA